MHMRQQTAGKDKVVGESGQWNIPGETADMSNNYFH